MELMVDVFLKLLYYLGLIYENVEELLDWGIIGLRMDYGIVLKEIVSVFYKMKVVLNVSMIIKLFWKELIVEYIRVENVEVWYNFYLCLEMGLVKFFL